MGFRGIIVVVAPKSIQSNPIRHTTTQVTTPESGGGSCITSETQPCATEPCPIDCVAAWSAWGACSGNCGTGDSFRTFVITEAAQFGGACAAANNSVENQTCTHFEFCLENASTPVGTADETVSLVLRSVNGTLQQGL